MSKLLRLAIIDDEEYWRSRIPVWLGRHNCEVEPYENYSFFELALQNGKSYDFILGDFGMLNQPRTGLEYLNDIANKYNDLLGEIIIFTVISEDQLDKRYADLGINKKFSYLNKKDITKFMEKILG